MPRSLHLVFLLLAVVATTRVEAAETFDVWEFTVAGSKGSVSFAVMSRGPVATHATMTALDEGSAIPFYAFGQVPAHFQLNPLGGSVSGLVADGSGLRGTMTVWAADNGLIRTLARLQTVTLAVSVDGSRRLSGTASFSAASASYLNGQTLAVSGRLTTQADNESGNSLPAGADWASWNGPNGDFSAPATPARAMIETPDQARLRWISEDFISAGAAGARFTFGPNGGASSPIVYGGRVYLYHYVPSGSVRFDRLADASRDPNPDPWGLVEADDVIICVDAATGRRLWRRVHERAGITAQAHKNELQGMSMAAADGRVFALGSTGTVYCHDAATGALIWSRKSPIDGAALEAVKQACIEETGFPPDGRSGGRSLQVAGGNLILPPVGSTATGTLAALDAATGALRWQRENLASTNATPVVWRAAGMGDRIITTLVLASGTAMITCLDAATGLSDWSLPAGTMGAGAVVHGDLLFINGSLGSSAHTARLTCLRLGLGGPTELWRLPEGTGGAFNFAPASRAITVGGEVIFHANPFAVGIAAGPMRLDPATGAQRGSMLTWNSVNEGMTVGCDQFLLYFGEYQHGKAFPVMLVPGQNGSRGVWQPAYFMHTTAYQTPWAVPVVDGRVFIRGGHNLYCYDFRKPAATGQAPVIAAIPDQTMAEDGVLRVTVSASDAETPASGLRLSAYIADPALATIESTYRGSNSIRLLSERQLTGSSQVTVHATDEDGNTASRSFLLTVTPGNDDPPVAGYISRTVLAGTSVTFDLINRDPEGAAGTFTVDAPANGLLSGSGATRTYTPNAGFTGVDNVAYTVTAGGATSAPAIIRIEVLSAPDTTPPALSTIANQSLAPGVRSPALAFTVGDNITPAASLGVDVFSRDGALLPRSGMVLGGSGASRTLSLTSPPGVSGSTVVTVVVRDASGNTASSSFTVSISGAGNTPPTVSAIPDQYTGLVATISVPFTIGDAETPVGSLQIARAGLAGPSLSGFGGTGANRWANYTINYTAPTTQIGGIRVTDAHGLTTTANVRFIISAPGATPPTISAIPDQYLVAGSVSAPLGFEIGDAETTATGLRLVIASSNTTVLPLSSIALGGSGRNRYLIISPSAAVTGSSVITLTVTDGGSPNQSTSGSFTVTVSPGGGNRPPVHTSQARAMPASLVLP